MSIDLDNMKLAGDYEFRKAQENPDGFRNLIVRISGCSTVFVTLDQRWQDAIIERKAKGM